MSVSHQDQVGELILGSEMSFWVLPIRKARQVTKSLMAPPPPFPVVSFGVLPGKCIKRCDHRSGLDFSHLTLAPPSSLQPVGKDLHPWRGSFWQACLPPSVAEATSGDHGSRLLL